VSLSCDDDSISPEMWKRVLDMKHQEREEIEQEVREADKKVVDRREQSQKDFKPFEVGEKVLLSRRKTGRKTDTINLGPYLVTERTSAFYYRVESINGGKKQKVHVSRRRRYQEGASVEEEKTAEAVDEHEYEVEKIITHRGRGKRKIQFRVKWKGYGMEENSWMSYKEVEETEAFEEYVYPKKSLWYLLSEKDKKEAEEKYGK
ncbi:hypothetical protein ADUPG1_001501, partial [Aduncisulcus paluster]